MHAKQFVKMFEGPFLFSVAIFLGGGGRGGDVQCCAILTTCDFCHVGVYFVILSTMQHMGKVTSGRVSVSTSM